MRDLGRHLDFTVRARVGALPLGLQVKLGLVRGKYIPAGLHAPEAFFCVCILAFGAFRAAIVRAVWSIKMPLAHTPAVLNLLHGPVGVDPALHIIWVRFRMMRRYLACCSEEESRIFRMLGLLSWSWPMHELGFAWDGDDKGWVRPSLLHPLDDGWPYSTFIFLHLGCLAEKVFVKLSEREGFRGVHLWFFNGSLQ